MKNVTLWIVLVFLIFVCSVLGDLSFGVFFTFNYKYKMHEQLKKHKSEPIPLIINDKFSKLKNSIFFNFILTAQILHTS